MRSSPPWSGALSYWSRRSRSSPAETRTTGLVLVSSAGSSPNTRTPTVRSLELPRVPVEGFLDHVAQETGVPLAVAELRTGENPLELAANRSPRSRRRFPVAADERRERRAGLVGVHLLLDDRWDQRFQH